MADVKPKRRNSLDSPPAFAELLQQLHEEAFDFRSIFCNNKSEMQDIENEFRLIANQIKEMHDATDTSRRAGVGVAIFAGLGGLIAPLLGLGLAAAAAACTLVPVNVTKIYTENQKIKEMEKMGNKLLQLLEPIKEKLEEIQSLCVELKELKTGVENSGKQAEHSLQETKTLARLIESVSMQSEESMLAVALLVNRFQHVIFLIAIIITPMATPGKDKELYDRIVNSAEQCKTTIDSLIKMDHALDTFILK